VKGGRRLRFNALVVVGDGQGEVGVGLGKALVIPDAVRKGNAVARRETVKIPLRGTTIPQKITVKKGATIVMIKPAREGTGVIAAGAMRAILELGGVKDVVGKSLGSRNPINIVYATIEALRQLRDPDVELARRLGRPMPSEANKVETVPVGANPEPAQANPVVTDTASVESLMSQRPGETLEGA
jgi:small subunit ribosomal protein S5